MTSTTLKEKQAANPSSQDSGILADVVNLMQGVRSGHMLERTYNEAGMKLWGEVARDPLFPANKESGFVSDPKLIGQLVHELIRVGKAPTFVELGSGLPVSVLKKTVPLLQAFQKAARGAPIDYVAVDLSAPDAEACANIVKEHIPNATVSSRSIDFLKTEGKLPVSGRPSIGIMWGGTLFNAQSDNSISDDMRLAGSLERLTGLLGADGRLITSYYFGDPDEVVRPYNTETNKALIRNILHVIQDKVEPNFDPNKFDIRIAYDATLQRISAEAVSNVDHEVVFNKLGGMTESFPKGRVLHLASSHKRGKDSIESLFYKGGHRVIKNVHQPDLGVGVVLSHLKRD